MNIYSENDSISILKLSKRAKNCLSINGYLTIGDIIPLSEQQLYAMNNAGKKTVCEIIRIKEEIMSEMGIEFSCSSDLVETKKGKEQEEKFLTLLEDFFWENEKYRNLSVKDMNLSFRSKNAMLRNNIHYFSEMLKYGEEDLYKLRNLGNKSVDEILEKKRILLMNLKKTEDNEEELPLETCDRDFEIRQVTSYITNKLSAVFGESTYLSQDIYHSVAAYYAQGNIVTNDSFDNDYQFTKKIYSRKYVNNQLIRTVYKLISVNLNGITYNSLRWYLPENTPEDTIKTVLMDLLDQGKIKISEGLYFVFKKSFHDCVEEITDERIKNILNERLMGKTLEEVGSIHSITRERVRQIEKKAIDKIQDIEEDRYQYLYTTYDLSREDFFAITKTDQETYYYLSQKYERGLLSLNKAFDDPAISIEIKKNIDNFSKRNLMLLEGEYVPVKREPLISYVLRNFFKETSSFQSFVKIYNKIVSEYPKEIQEKLSLGARNGLVNRLSDRNDLLWKVNQKIRYYNIDDLDKEAFYNELDLSKYNDCHLSTLKIFRDNKEIMKKADLRDHYELHNILRKSIDGQVGFKVVFHRMPMITIGEGDEEEQVYNILIDHSPITAERLGDLYERKYGVKSYSARSNLFMSFEKYYHNGVYSIDITPMPIEVKHEIKKQLDQDFYFLETVEAIYRRNFPDMPMDYINPHTLKDLGFHVFSKYLVKDSFLNARDYFNYLLTKDSTINLDMLDPRITKIQTFYLILQEHKRNYELLEYEEGKYYNISYLQGMDITKKNLTDYSYKLFEMNKEKEFFVISSVRNKEIEKKFGLDEGFSNLFFEGILAQDMRFYSFKIKNNKIFCTESRNANKTAFFLSAMEKIPDYDIDMIKHLLLDEYGINLSSKVINNTVNTIKRNNEECGDE